MSSNFWKFNKNLRNWSKNITSNSRKNIRVSDIFSRCGNSNTVGNLYVEFVKKNWMQNNGKKPTSALFSDKIVLIKLPEMEISDEMGRTRFNSATNLGKNEELGQQQTLQELGQTSCEVWWFRFWWEWLHHLDKILNADAHSWNISSQSLSYVMFMFYRNCKKALLTSYGYWQHLAVRAKGKCAFLCCGWGARWGCLCKV